MADLFSSLTMATRAMEAQRFALDATGQNIANVNTPGYSRRVVDFASVPPETPRGAGNGVEVTGIRAQRDRLIERRLYMESAGAERHSVIADSLSVVEATLGATGSSLDSRLNEFFTSLSRLADTPTGAVERQELLLQGTALATTFNDMEARFAEFARDADRRVGQTVEEINTIVQRIATLNDALSNAGHTGPGLHMQDEQATLVRQLATLTDIVVIDRPDGGVDIDSGAGRALVVGASAYTMTAAPTGLSGERTISMSGVDITASLTGGRLGGLLQVRDRHIPGYLDHLDAQAHALATAVNTAHTGGVDLDGNAGEPFFVFTTPPVGTSGAAAALALNPAIAADLRKVAASATGAPGDNQVARELAALRDAALMEGGTATLADSWAQFIYRVGRDVQGANQETALRKQIVLQVEALRDQVSGVSLDEEALNLMKFQRAYEANARFFQVVDSALDMLFDAVRR
jgi:flagellar hook-associated protein 1 FlgK